MANLTLTCTAVVSTGGKVYVRWSDGVELEFRNLADARAYADRLVTDNVRDVLRRMAISRYLFVDPTGATPSLIVGHTITATNESNTMVQVT